jgi:hypothetical protein
VVYYPHTRELPYGVDFDFYWAHFDTHWRPEAVELAANLILAEARGEQAEALLPAANARIAAQMAREMRE